MKQQRVRRASDLLSSWKTVPGSRSDGQMDHEKLEKWVHEARWLCNGSGRGEVGDFHIGQVFAHATAEEEGIWPAKPVCRLIDKIQSSDLDRGFYTGIRNSRGVTTRSILEGGNQERELATRFGEYSGKLAARYPRTASVLAKVAESYSNEARWEDEEAKRRDMEY